MSRRMIFLAVLAIALVGCETAPKTDTDKAVLDIEAKGAVDAFLAEDPSLQRFFDTAKGYAVFPSIGKGAFVVGGGYGKGVVYEGGSPVGHCSVSYGSVGLQIGGQAFREIIFFQDDVTMARFKRSEFELSAQASAVVVSAGGSTTTDYNDGVAVFTMPKGGVMYEASVAGQKFRYQPR